MERSKEDEARMDAREKETRTKMEKGELPSEMIMWYFWDPEKCRVAFLPKHEFMQLRESNLMHKAIQKMDYRLALPVDPEEVVEINMRYRVLLSFYESMEKLLGDEDKTHHEKIKKAFPEPWEKPKLF